MRQRVWFIGALLVQVLLVSLLLTGGVYAAEPLDPSEGYAQLLARLKGGDTAIDYAKLRYGFASTAAYNPYAKFSAEREAMFKALESKQFDLAVKQAKALLDQNYQDMESHFVCVIAFGESGNQSQKAYHNAVLKGLIGSLYASGDGKSPETAYQVISTDEEYFLFNINGYRTIRQSLIEKDGVHYDKMELEYTKTGAKVTMYFNVERPFSWISRQFKKK